MKRISLVILAVLVSFSAFGAKEIKFPDSQNGPHFLYLPNKIDPAKTYWVVVGVHGADWRNRGAFGMSKWVDRKDNVIVVGPKFSKTYQNARKEDQDLLIGIFKDLQKKYKVHPKMFIFGYSGGSQFGSRFVMKQPDYVCGISSHSGGSWGTGKYGKINPAAKHIPFAISCGEKDTGKAWKDAPYGRLEWFRVFEKEMEKGKFFYKSATWPGGGHGKAKGVDRMTEECFALATTGSLPGKGGFGDKIKEAKKLASKGEFAKAEKLKAEISRASVELPADSGWNDSKEAKALRRTAVSKALAEIDTSPATKAKFGLYRQCVAALKSDKKPTDKALFSFMERCPPSFWINKEDASIVKPACSATAEKYIEHLRSSKRMGLAVYQKYIVLWDGLPIRDKLLKEYDAAAEPALAKVLAMKDGSFKKRALQGHIRKWKVGTTVDKAQAELARQ